MWREQVVLDPFPRWNWVKMIVNWQIWTGMMFTSSDSSMYVKYSTIYYMAYLKLSSLTVLTNSRMTVLDVIESSFLEISCSLVVIKSTFFGSDRFDTVSVSVVKLLRPTSQDGCQWVGWKGGLITPSFPTKIQRKRGVFPDFVANSFVHSSTIKDDSTNCRGNTKTCGIHQQLDFGTTHTLPENALLLQRGKLDRHENLEYKSWSHLISAHTFLGTWMMLNVSTFPYHLPHLIRLNLWDLYPIQVLATRGSGTLLKVPRAISRAVCTTISCSEQKVGFVEQVVLRDGVIVIWILFSQVFMVKLCPGILEWQWLSSPMGTPQGKEWNSPGNCKWIIIILKSSTSEPFCWYGILSEPLLVIVIWTQGVILDLQMRINS